MEAFRASKLVLAAIWAITWTIWPIFWDDSPKRLTLRVVSATVSLICKIPATVCSTASPPLRAVEEADLATSSASRAFSATL